MKSVLNQNQLLEDSMSALKLKREMQAQDFKMQYSQMIDSFKPSNIISQSIMGLSNSSALQGGSLKSSVMGTAVGYLTRKLIPNKNNSFFKNILGYMIQATVTSYIASKIDRKLSDQYVEVN